MLGLTNLLRSNNWKTKNSKASYTAVEPPSESIQNADEDEQNQKERLEPVVKAIVPSQRNVKSKNNKSIFGFIKNLIGTSEDEIPEKKKEEVTKGKEEQVNKLEEYER